jgi:hypothetical protein
MKGTHNLDTKQKRIVVYTIIGSLFLALGIVALGFTGNELSVSSSQIEISGLYGETIAMEDIKSITLTDKRPAISGRKHGFSIGYRKKGIYSNKDGERIKLLINARIRPYILITKTNDQKIYFSSGTRSNTVIFGDLKSRLPGKTF